MCEAFSDLKLVETRFVEPFLLAFRKVLNEDPDPASIRASSRGDSPTSMKLAVTFIKRRGKSQRRGAYIRSLLTALNRRSPVLFEDIGGRHIQSTMSASYNSNTAASAASAVHQMLAERGADLEFTPSHHSD